MVGSLARDQLKMVYRGTISSETRAYIKFKRNTSATELHRETGVSRVQIYRIWKEEPKENIGSKSRQGIGGRPKKLTAKDERLLLRQVPKLRKEFPNWTARRLMADCKINNVSVRTITRLLNRNGYKSRQARKKGLISKSDQQKRVKFAKKMIKEYPEDVWTKHIAFYFDGVSFVYKRHPKDQALAPRGRVWRRANEGLLQGCTAKGQKCGTGGKQVKLFVAISHNQGVISADTYDHLNGENFAHFVYEKFDTIFDSARKNTRMWIQDGDPSQNSKLAKDAMVAVNAQLLQIPPRSPDINPIENIFHLVKRQLDRQAIEENIVTETMADFETRIKRTLFELPVSHINNIIESMGNRMKKIITEKGNRLKY